MSHRVLDGVLYVVKSHRRVNRFRDKTYAKVIQEYGFPTKDVYVFVSLDEDVALYRAAYPEINVVKAPEGVAAVDNFITDYFPDRQKLVYMNDDVTGLLHLRDGKLHHIGKSDLTELLHTMFAKMWRNRITYGGFYPVANTMFMAGKKVTYDFCLIMDPFSLVINNKKIRITIADKSDFEKSIQHFHHQGALMRYNHMALRVEYYGSQGGFQGRDAKTEKETALRMQAKYPQHVAGVRTKKDGKTSLRFKPIAAKRRIN